MLHIMSLKNYLILFLIVCFSFSNVHAQSPTSTNQDRLQWWKEARFGLFIHWGVYAQWGGVYHGHQQARYGAEWIMNRSKIPVQEYQDTARSFNPINYNPESWVLLAKNAGMKYIIITAKHHDGFALFKSQASNFNVVDFTAYGKDLLKPLAEACRKHGIKLGFYYSQAQDWNNPGGTAARKLMREGWPNPDSVKVDAYTAAHNGHWDPIQYSKSFEQYIDSVAVPQVREILSNYGDVAVLWWDTPVGMTDEAAQKLHDLLKLQPNIITNDRLKRPNFLGDSKTPEQSIPTREELDGSNWETCMTMNGSWGYKSWDHNWKSTETLIHNLIDIASKGGNYLLNIGPKPDGTIPEESIERLKQIGEWMAVNGEAIYATQPSPLRPLKWGRCTAKHNQENTILYLSVFDWPSDGVLRIPGLSHEVVSAELISDRKRLNTKLDGNQTLIDIPQKAPNDIASVIRLEVKGHVQDANVQNPKKSMNSGALDEGK
ncbi:alpha-L-fucosidase [Sphingobacterium paludis]|nr:alpha-L-fucosidase [Sphingobacterium paludis]